VSKIKLFVAIPTTGSVVDSQTYALRELEARYGDQIEFIYPKQCVRRMFHDFARNAMVEEFLASEADCLWFLDSDITPPKHVLDLVTLHYPKWQAAGAPYPVFMTASPGKGPQVVFCVYNGTDGKGLCPSIVPNEGTAFVSGIATGCLFLKREILESMQAPYFEFQYENDTRSIAEGEDIHFCKKLGEKGVQFFIDYSMVCKHEKRVCLLDVNNYAIDMRNQAVLAYDAEVRPQVAALAAKIKSLAKAGESPTPSPTILTPTLSESQAINRSVLPGSGGPFVRGNAR
jgi:hypothetical protein